MLTLTCHLRPVRADKTRVQLVELLHGQRQSVVLQRKNTQPPPGPPS